MIQVAAVIKVCSFIDVVAEAYTIGCCLSCSFSLIIIFANIGGQHLIGHTFVCLCREVKPALCVAMVDDNICYRTDTVSFKFGNQVPEFCLCSERRVLIEIIIWLIAHYLYCFSTFPALWKPNKVDIVFHIFGLVG